MSTKKQPLALARPAVYIEVALARDNGKMQIYDVPTARELHEQLGLAIAALDDSRKDDAPEPPPGAEITPLKDPDAAPEDPETQAQSESPTPDDQASAASDDAPLVADAGVRPVA